MLKVTRIERKQSNTNKRNHEIQKKITTLSLEQLITSVIQELQNIMKIYMEKMGEMFNSLVTLFARIT